MNKIYLVVWGKTIVGDNSLDFDECRERNVSDWGWKDKELADKFAKECYNEMREYISDDDIDDERLENGYYSANFVDAYGDTANEIFAYVKEIKIA